MVEVNKCTYCKLLSSLQRSCSKIPMAISFLPTMLLGMLVGIFRDKWQIDEELMYFYKFIWQKNKQQAEFFINPLWTWW